ncbi:hypothetical protein [Novosphingobium mangrovi (ex Huang et al. 2023)]|uniref:Lipoprotein n=1 Tax=Novosphingobium mangrovi (ex Huang et al. 2023) TaxID=2976432 RepID=A0ABT2I1H5_9SPHN|nr:hypothetical protein [Novosphingobium mangrovi (ex Huang et al. 2023)]MCT2398657.1 hypothetical protein [Novosphingobium mangrovi (ex Huang et al. 2023)]
MRSLLALSFLITVGACSEASDGKIDEIDLRVSGWSSVDISLTRQGEGHFELDPSRKVGAFNVTPQQFDQFRKRLEPYRQAATPYSDSSALQFIQQGCPDGSPQIRDAGAVYIRWVGSGLDEHFLADFGCNASQNAARNKSLLNAVKSLPIPVD